MRVAVWHNLPSGGGNRAVHDHVRGLVSSGHAVEVWCPPTADRSFAPLGPMVEEHVVGLDLPAPKRLTEKLQFTLQTERELAAMERHCARCAAEIDAGGFDVLFANTCMFFRMTPIARLSRTPSVMYLQEPYRWLYEALPRLKWLAKPQTGLAALRPAHLRTTFLDWRDIRNARLQARHEVDDAAAFDTLLVNSYFSQESVARAYGVPAQVCYLGIDTEHFVDKAKPREGFVVGLGSITPEKNIGLVIEALGIMARPRLPLVWIGNMALPGYRAEMEALALARGVTLELRVGVPAAEVVDVLGRATAMVYAPRLEPFGLAPLEANACGVPVVAVPEGGVRETIHDGVNGLLAERDPVSIAAALCRIRDDADLAARLRRQSRDVVERRWSMAAATERLEAYLLGTISAARNHERSLTIHEPVPAQS